MKGKEIKAVVLLLDKDRDYFQLESKGKAKRRRELSLAERLAMADSDPAFLWNLAVTDALAGHPLPSFVCNSSALRANCFYLYPGHPDIHIAVVQSLGLPRMKPRRNLLRALICCAVLRSSIPQGGITVSWPSADTASFALEQAATLAPPPSWVTNAAGITDDGTNKSVTLPATNRSQFFRLRRP